MKCLPLLLSSSSLINIVQTTNACPCRLLHHLHIPLLSYLKASPKMPFSCSAQICRDPMFSCLQLICLPKLICVPQNIQIHWSFNHYSSPLFIISLLLSMLMVAGLVIVCIFNLLMIQITPYSHYLIKKNCFSFILVS